MFRDQAPVKSNRCDIEDGEDGKNLSYAVAALNRMIFVLSHFIIVFAVFNPFNRDNAFVFFRADNRYPARRSGDNRDVFDRTSDNESAVRDIII